MLPPQTIRKGLLTLVALVLGVGLCAVNIHAQSQKPYTKDAIVGMLKGQVAPQRVAVLARQRGIDFPITPEVEGELRRAGAAEALMATLRELAPKLPKAPTPGQARENPKDGLKYVWIPPGTFMMGCSPGDNECADREKPAHQVTMTRGFWIGQTLVTVGAYKGFAGATGRPMPTEPNILGRVLNPGWVNEAMPIENVTWDEANAYCAWVGGRLPTEAEWEYAARGGNAEARYGPLDDIAWYGDNSGLQRLDSTGILNGDPKSYRQRLKDNGNGMHEVGSKRPNAFGLYDVLGNTLQWVNDWFALYRDSPSQDPQGPASGKTRVLRGADWGALPRSVRVSIRYGNLPTTGFGFRCAREVVGP